MSDLSIHYNKKVLSSLDYSAEKTLKTKGLYCYDNIKLNYNRPQVSPDVSVSEFKGSYQYNSSDPDTNSFTVNGFYISRFSYISNDPLFVAFIHNPSAPKQYLYPDWSQPFEVGVALNVSSIYTEDESVVFGGKSSKYKNPLLKINEDGSVWGGWSCDGSTRDCELLLPIDSVQSGIWYHIRYLYDGTKFKLGISSDLVNYREVETTPSGAFYGGMDVPFGFGGDFDGVFYNGTINTLGTYVKVSDDLVWGCTYLQDHHTFNWP